MKRWVMYTTPGIRFRIFKPTFMFRIVIKAMGFKIKYEDVPDDATWAIEIIEKDDWRLDI